MRLFGNGTFTHTRFVGPANPLTKSWPNASGTWLRRLEFGTLFFVEMYLVSMGFATQALERYRLALGIAERLVEQEPGRADYLRELSVSYGKIGDLQSALGQGETARQFYEKALGIAERLVEQEPGRADYLRDLSVAYG